ncbi:MAG: ACT domain-containing protein [Clostridia bacterium]|jgi:ACT domain-containing protein|nr:ACT domain-containing protein [Clostridia bacterium]
MKAIVTVIGKDKSGIIAGVSNMLAKKQINIEDISQTILQGYFTMIMLVDIDENKITIDELNKEAEIVGNEIGVKIIIQHEDIFNAMYRV